MMQNMTSFPFVTEPRVKFIFLSALHFCYNLARNKKSAQTTAKKARKIAINSDEHQKYTRGGKEWREKNDAAHQLHDDMRNERQTAKTMPLIHCVYMHIYDMCPENVNKIHTDGRCWQT